MSTSARNNGVRAAEKSNHYIPGGVSSMNRMVNPPIPFARGKGAYIWDSDGKKYIDFHAAFAPYLLGHNNEDVNNAVIKMIGGGKSLFGSGPTEIEGELASLMCNEIESLEKITFLNTGSEATALAVRLSRAFTNKDHLIVMQGGYNGNGDELACNVFNNIEEIGPRVSPGEYPIRPLGAGTVFQDQGLIHVLNFNDLDSVRHACEEFPIAALITEPVLQNIGVVKPVEGYLEGLRALADEFGFVLIFDEIKTGFRQGVGGFSSVANVRPDLVTFAKAVANGYPVAMLGGKAEFMNIIAADDPKVRPFVAGTYNGHPMALAAAIATVSLLKNRSPEIYDHLENLGQLAESGISSVLSKKGIVGSVARVGSAFAVYFMDHCPVDFHDMLLNHDFDRDVQYRKKLIGEGIYFVPIATKQCSISAAHSEDDIERMIDRFSKCIS